MRSDDRNPNLEAELNSYAASRGAQSADWSGHLRRWPIYAAATGAALAMATSADANSIISGYSGQKINVEPFQVASRTGAETVVNLGGLGDVGLRLFYSRGTNGIVFSRTGQARVFGSHGTVLNATGGELARFNAGQAITQGMSHATNPILHEQIFRYLIGADRVLTSLGVGQWPTSNKTGFAGFTLANGDLGWIQLDWTTNGGFPTSLQALNWAVETAPGVSIEADQTDSGPGVAPEPGTLGLSLLAIGAAGIAAWRRSRRAQA
jgi:hypothetical protein